MARFRESTSKRVFSNLAWTLTKLDLSGTNELHFYGWYDTAKKVHGIRVKEFRVTKQKQCIR